MASIHMKKKVSVTRVIAKIVITILALWVGDKILQAVNSSLNASGALSNTNSFFYQGFNFLGMGAATVNGAGILGVISLIAVASLVMEFVEISF